MYKVILNRVWEILLLMAVVGTLFVVGTSLTRAQDVGTTNVPTDEIVIDVSETVVDESTTSEGALFVPIVEEGELIVDIFPPATDENVIVASDTDTVVETAAVEETPTDDAPVVDTEAIAPQNTPELTTDKDDYHPGETATIFGRFFAPLTNFILKIFGSDENDQNYTETETIVETDEAGSFSFAYLLDSLYRPFYEVVVSTLEGEKIAETWFRDAAVGTYDQCSNDDGDGYAAGDQGCRWINGNLQSNNSVYFEHDATVQRLWLEGFEPGSINTVTLKYGTTKGGKHAYDYLTEWNHSETWVTVPDRCQGITGCEAETDLPLQIPNDPIVSDLIEPNVASRVFTMRGGNPTSATSPAIVSGTYAGDSETAITITFTVDSSGTMCSTKGSVTSCGIVLWFGAHVSSQADWGTGNSAVNISGSPYHVALDLLDGTSVGQRDNQMASAAVVANASITIIKNAVPDSAQDFSFTTNGTGLSPFLLDDDADGTLLNIKVFTGLASGVYTVTEALQAGWTLTGTPNCVDATTNSTINLGTRVATINLAAGENVTCTFVNTLQTGTLVVQKTTIPSGDTTQFTINTTGSGVITDGGAGVITDATDKNYTVTAGAYSVTETVPLGWAKTGDTCQNVVVNAGATSTCVFTNTKLGSLTLIKNTFGGNGDFDFDATGTGLSTDIDLTTVAGTAQSTFTNLNPANIYTLAETVPSGWLLNSAVCDNSETIENINIDPGQTVTCTFTNTKQPTLTVNKILVPSNDLGKFNLRIDGQTAGTGANVGNGGTTGAQIVSVGAHTVSETAGTNTTLTDYTGVIGGDCATNGSITLAAGENKVCTITNTRNTGTIELQKDFVGTPESVTIKIGTSENGTQVDSDVLIADGTNGEHTKNTGTYFVSEALTTPANYTSTLACYNDVNDSGTVDGGDTAHAVNTTTGEVAVGSNDDVLCVYTNTRNTGTVVIKKVMIGGTDTFDFTGTPNGSISVDGGTTQAVVETGAYVGTESVKAGWDLTSLVCDDQNSTGDVNARTANFNVESGATVTCTFTNTKRGSITIEKQTLPDADPASFTFTGDVIGSLSDGQTATQAVVPGAYASTEALKAGWDLTGISCDDGDSSGVVGTGVATFNVAAGENVKCTFTNTKKGHLIVQKTTLPAANPTQFTIAASGSGTLTGGGAGVITDATDKDYEVTPGTYSVVETIPAGWDKTGDTCQGVVVAAGETKTCLITNTKRGSITIVKDVIGNPDATDFTFNNNFGNGNPATFLLDEDTNGTLPSTRTFEVLPGTYAVSEQALAGWSQESETNCDSGETIDSIDVAPGESVTCTFVNEEYAKIILVKNTLGGNGDFSFGKTGVGFAGATTLTTVAGTASQTFVDLDQDNTYTIAETVPAGWDLTNAVCTGAGNTPASITPDPGETVTCTFTNTKRGHIIVDKVTDPVGDTQSFSFTTNAGSNFALTDAEAPHDSGAVIPGTYSVFETVPAGWDLTNTSCVSSNQNAETAGNISLQAGETITCTFTNTKRGHIIVDKVTYPASDPQSFSFTAGGAGYSNFALTDAAAPNNQEVVPGAYSVSEGAIAGWANTSATCDLGETPASLDVGPGETVTCMFVNNKPAAQIDLDPLTATNKIGDNHVITADVQVQNGDGVWGPAVNGTLVAFGITNSNGANAVFVGGHTCTTTAGSCVITINSPTSGSVAVHASSTPTVLGVALNVQSGTGGDNSADAAKTYVNAKISINPPTSTNEINDDHDYIVKVEADNGDGTGFQPVSAAIANAIVSPATSLTISDCNDGTNASGECTVTINSAVAGIFTITARSTITVGGIEFKLQTNGSGLNSVPATKTFVDAKISIGVDGVNEVGDPHTFTGHVDVHNGSGWTNAPDGTTINLSLSGVGTLSAPSCITTGGTGSCSVTDSSSVAGTDTVNASTSVTVGGVTLLRSTNGTAGNSGPATKKWVDAYITIGASATNNITDDHVFTITVTQIPGGATPATSVDITPSVTPTPDVEDTTCDSSVVFVGNVATCTLTINNNTPGVFTASASAALTVGGVALTRSTDGVGSNSNSAIKTYVAGALQITKIVDLGSVVNPSAIDDTFTVTVTGPSYLLGHNIVFTLTDGVLQTPTTVSLSPLIPGNYTVTEADAGTEWTEVVTTSSVSVVASAISSVTITNTYVPGSLEVNKIVDIGAYKIPSGVDLDFTINVTGPSYPVPHAVVINVVNGVPTNSPQTLTNLIPGEYTVTEVNPGIQWTVTGGGAVIVHSGAKAVSTVTNTLKQPHTTISITANTQETTAGGNVILTITDTNDGEVPLTNNSVAFNYNGVTTTLDKNSPNFSGDTNDNGIMEVGETWTWVVTVTITANTTFTVAGHGFDPLGNDITPTNGYTTEAGSIVIRVIGTTRTLGFWQTHTAFTSAIFATSSMKRFVGVDLPVVFGQSKGRISNIISPLGQSHLFGGFYAAIAKTTLGAKRTAIDQARIQMLQQLLAAKLNCAAFGCSGATLTLIGSADAAYAAGASKAAIITLAGQLDAFNNSGDANAIPAGLGATGKATPKVSQSYANLVFWNLP